MLYSQTLKANWLVRQLPSAFLCAPQKGVVRRRASVVKRTFLLFFAIFLLTAMAPVFIKPVAAATTYIRANGSVDPPNPLIQQNGNVYTFTGNINDSLVVQTDNIVIDGGGYALQGPGGMSGTTAIALTGRNNVTIRNMKVTGFY